MYIKLFTLTSLLVPYYLLKKTKLLNETSHLKRFACNLLLLSCCSKLISSLLFLKICYSKLATLKLDTWNLLTETCYLKLVTWNLLLETCYLKFVSWNFSSWNLLIESFLLAILWLLNMLFETFTWNWLLGTWFWNLVLFTWTFLFKTCYLLLLTIWK